MRQSIVGLGARLDLQSIHPQVERRAAGQGLQFRHEIFAQERPQGRLDPFREIARNVGRRVREIGAFDPRPLLACRRFGRKSFAREQSCDLRECHPALKHQHAEHHRPWRGFAHDPGGRGFAAERIIHEAGDRRPVLGAGEAVRQPPILESLRGGAATGLDVAENLDGGGKAGCGCHEASQSFFERSERNRAAPPPIDR